MKKLVMLVVVPIIIGGIFCYRGGAFAEHTGPGRYNNEDLQKYKTPDNTGGNTAPNVPDTISDKKNSKDGETQEINNVGPTISFRSTGWDGTKSFYQVAGTATFSGGGIEKVEYFINDGDTPGTGVMISGGSGLSPLMFTFSIPENALKSGDNTICVHALSSTSVWGSPTCLTATK